MKWDKNFVTKNHSIYQKQMEGKRHDNYRVDNNDFQFLDGTIKNNHVLHQFKHKFQKNVSEVSPFPPEGDVEPEHQQVLKSDAKFEEIMGKFMKEKKKYIK